METTSFRVGLSGLLTRLGHQGDIDKSGSNLEYSSTTAFGYVCVSMFLSCAFRWAKSMPAFVRSLRIATYLVPELDDELILKLYLRWSGNVFVSFADILMLLNRLLERDYDELQGFSDSGPRVILRLMARRSRAVAMRR